MERCRPADRLDHEVGLRVGQQEQADPGDPQYPPGDVVRPEPIRQIPPKRPQHAGGQCEAHRHQCRLAYREAIFVDEILWHPDGNRSEAAEDDRVVLAVLPDSRVAQNRQLPAQRHQAARFPGIRRGEQPEQRRRHEQGDGIGPGHALPAIAGNQRRRDEHIDGGTGRAGTEDAHRETLPLPRKEPGRIGRAHCKGRADQPERQPQQQELPESRRIGRQPERHGADDEQDEHDDATAEPVRPDSQRQAEQRADIEGLDQYLEWNRQQWKLSRRELEP